MNRIHQVTVLGLAALWLCSCDIKSDFDAQKIRQGIKDHKIKRVTDRQIVQAAYDKGLSISKALLATAGDDPCAVPAIVTLPDSLSGYVVQHRSICQDTDTLSATEQKVISAYRQTPEAAADNIQKMPDGDLLFTAPRLQQGRLHVLCIVISRKQIVRFI